VDEGYKTTVAALRAEAGAALEAGRWDDVLGVARALFNIARTEKDILAALELAAQVMAGKGGGMEAGNAFLGLVHDEASQPKEWREARLGEKWRESLQSARAAIDAGTNAAAWRHRAWFALITGDGDEALADAATAYRLPDMSDKSQELTLETVGMAFRARIGTVAAAERFVRFQRQGPANPGETSGLPAATVIDISKQLAGAWNAVREQGAKNVASAETEAAIHNYASCLSLAGRPDEALGVMRSLYFRAVTPKEFEQATLGVASALRALDEHPLRANAWLAYQSQGPNGPDRLSDPLVGEALRLPADWAEVWRALAEKENEPDRRVRLLLLAGDAPATLPVLMEAQRTLPFQEAAYKNHLALAVAALKALHGHPHVGKNYADYLRYGSNGPDGLPGTADDLTNPLTDPMSKPDTRPAP